jgi:hypothetical protein
MKETPTKKEILARRKEIEEEFSELLKEYDSSFTLEYIKDIIWHEEETDDMMKIVAIFDTGQGAIELDNIIELASDAWNYLPHQILDGRSPMEKLLEAKG